MNKWIFSMSGSSPRLIAEQIAISFGFMLGGKAFLVGGFHPIERYYVVNMGIFPKEGWK